MSRRNVIVACTVHPQASRFSLIPTLVYVFVTVGVRMPARVCRFAGCNGIYVHPMLTGSMRLDCYLSTTFERSVWDQRTVCTVLNHLVKKHELVLGLDHPGPARLQHLDTKWKRSGHKVEKVQTQKKCEAK